MTFLSFFMKSMSQQWQHAALVPIHVCALFPVKDTGYTLKFIVTELNFTMGKDCKLC